MGDEMRKDDWYEPIYDDRYIVHHEDGTSEVYDMSGNQIIYNT